jgi:glyceraldehyde 3-phosphate dehydrogenase
MTARVAINGLGRIGRATLKIIMDDSELELVAVNDIADPKNLAYLLKFDSVYGRYEKSIEVREGELDIDGSTIRVLGEKDPSKLPWDEMKVDIVFECTGIFTEADELRKHIEAGARKAILSAPAKSEMSTVIPGVNEARGDIDIVSCGSCTTNAIAPVLEVMGRRIGIRKAIMNTIHAYTTSQGIVDGPAKKMRRGRAGAVNLVPTSTGAAKVTTRVLPQYEGKFDGLAIRAPIPVGSIADVTFVTERATSVEEINDIFREEADSERYRGIMGASDDLLVSSDIVKDPRAAIIDLESTLVVDGDLVKILSWYDNEWAYAAQMVRQAKTMAAG